MIRKNNECNVELRENMRGGDGTVKIRNLAAKEELCDKGRLFAEITLEPGSSIGYHVHEGDTEIFRILQGTAEYSDNGEIKTVEAGDVLICPEGTGHSIKNIGDIDVVMTALIVYA